MVDDALFGHLHSVTHHQDREEVWQVDEEADSKHGLPNRDFVAQEGGALTNVDAHIVEEPCTHGPAYVHQGVEHTKAKGCALDVGETLDTHTEYGAGDSDTKAKG